MKKIFFATLFSLVFSFGLFNLVNASASISVDSYADTISISCDNGPLYEVGMFDPNGTGGFWVACDGLVTNDTFTSGFGVPVEGNYTAVIYSTSDGFPNDYADAQIFPSAIDLGTIYIYDENFAPLSMTGLIFSRDENGYSTANLLTASVGTATQTTFESLGNILAVVGGILLAFGAINYIIALIKETNDEKKKKRI
jgi:hypothetical protein